MRMHHFLGQRWSICPKQESYGENPDIYFHLPIDPFHCAKFQKKFLQQIQSYEDVPFLGSNMSNLSICGSICKVLRK